LRCLASYNRKFGAEGEEEELEESEKDRKRREGLMG
jgi:hypothetical protein